jgi:hypothetical protein
MKKMKSDFLDFGIVEYNDEYENVKVFLHMKDKTILMFDHVVHDPVRYQGSHKWFGNDIVHSKIPSDNFEYVSYVITPRKDDEFDETESIS